MEKLFVVGDIYGYRSKAEDLLSKWNPDSEKLIFLGNILGKGEDSCGMLRKVIQLIEEYGAVLLSGKNEDQFIRWLSSPLDNTADYYKRSGREIINSFFDDIVTNRLAPESLAQDIIFTYYKEINFIQNLPLYIAEKNHLCVPASVRLNGDWMNSTVSEFRIGTESFESKVNRTNKTILFGTIPTSLLNKDKSNNAWLSPCRTKIGLNGSPDRGGYCHAIKLRNDEHEFFVA